MATSELLIINLKNEGASLFKVKESQVPSMLGSWDFNWGLDNKIIVTKNYDTVAVLA